MSSFLVSEKTIDVIVTAIWGEESGHWRFGLPEHPTNAQLTKLGQKLIMLNLHALNQRYGDKIDKNIAKKYKFCETHATPVQLFKNLSCFTYQCSEGKIPKSKLYKQLENYESTCARLIVYDLPEYEKAEWDAQPKKAISEVALV